MGMGGSVHVGQSEHGGLGESAVGMSVQGKAWPPPSPASLSKIAVFLSGR